MNAYIVKKTDSVGLYLSDDDKLSKNVNIIKMAKDETVFSRDGRRRTPLRRLISERPLIKINVNQPKEGSRKEVCRLCQHTTSRKKMHIHFVSIIQTSSVRVSTGMPVMILFTVIKEVGPVPPPRKVSTK